MPKPETIPASGAVGEVVVNFPRTATELYIKLVQKDVFEDRRTIIVMSETQIQTLVEILHRYGLEV